MLFFSNVFSSEITICTYKFDTYPAFHWNFKDTYVLALDEIIAPTMIHCLIADRMKRRKLAPLLKLV